MYEYTHGGNAIFENSEILDLSANINPLGIPQYVLEAIKNEFTYLPRYPDNFSKELRSAIALFERVDPTQIFCSNGASDILFRLPIALKAKKALILAPTFSDYERALRSFGTEVYYCNLKEENEFEVKETILDEFYRSKADLIIICNPNNPTGELTKREIIESVLIASLKTGAQVVVDECFMDFVNLSDEYTAKSLISKYKNLIILKAFTKMFALPGIRLGYSLCSNEDTIRKLYFHGADWAVSNLAQAAGIAALHNSSDYIKKTVEYVTSGRNYMKSNLESLGFTTFGSHANYVFFKSPLQFNLWEELNKIGIRIRSCNNYVGLSPSFYRVAISTHENNDRFVNALKIVIGSKKL